MSFPVVKTVVLSIEKASSAVLFASIIAGESRIIVVCVEIAVIGFLEVGTCTHVLQGKVINACADGGSSFSFHLGMPHSVVQVR